MSENSTHLEAVREIFKYSVQWLLLMLCWTVFLLLTCFSFSSELNLTNCSVYCFFCFVCTHTVCRVSGGILMYIGKHVSLLFYTNKCTHTLKMSPCQIPTSIQRLHWQLQPSWQTPAQTRMVWLLLQLVDACRGKGHSLIDCVPAQLVLLLCSQPRLGFLTAGDSVNPSVSYVYEFAAIDLPTLLLIKRTPRQSGVSATPGGIEVGVCLCLCAVGPWFMPVFVQCWCVCIFMSERACLFLWVFHETHYFMLNALLYLFMHVCTKSEPRQTELNMNLINYGWFYLY